MTTTRKAAAALLLVACTAPGAVDREPRSPAGGGGPTTFASLLGGPPELEVTVHPMELQRDPAYGPLLRRASELAAAYTGPTSFGTTTLAALERTSEIVVGERDHGRNAIVVLHGVPADIEPLAVVDTSGHAIWRSVAGDVRASSRELAPADGTDAALFIVPGLTWVIAAGPAVPEVRAAVNAGRLGPGALSGDDTPLLAVSLPGGALPQLRQGSLATVGQGLGRVELELSPGKTGLILVKLSYPDAPTAASSEATVRAVTLAFRHRIEEDLRAPAATADAGAIPKPATNLDWLGAAKVEREGSLVVVRAPIPRPWLELLKRADVLPP